MKPSVDSLKAIEAGQRRLNAAEFKFAAMALDVPVGVPTKTFRTTCGEVSTCAPPCQLSVGLQR